MNSRAVVALLLLLPAGLPWVAAAADREFRTAEEVLATFKDEPDVRHVQAMVLEYSKTDPAYVERWLSATKNAALLPQFKVTYDYDDGYGSDFDYIVLTDGAEPLEQIDSSNVDVKNGIQLQATWKLDELVMSSERIRMISETQDIVKLRDKVLEEVTRLYFDRRRLQVDMLLNGGDLKAQLKNQLRLEELTAQLDAYTGGQFSASLKAGAPR